MRKKGPLQKKEKKKKRMKDSDALKEYLSNYFLIKLLSLFFLPHKHNSNDIAFLSSLFKLKI